MGKEQIQSEMIESMIKEKSVQKQTTFEKEEGLRSGFKKQFFKSLRIGQNNCLQKWMTSISCIE